MIRPAFAATSLVIGALTAGYGNCQELVPDAQRALRLHLSSKAADQIASRLDDPAVAEKLRKHAHPELVDALTRELPANTASIRRPGISANIQQAIRQRILLDQLSRGAIPMDALRDVVPTITIETLRSAATGATLDLKLANRLDAAFGATVFRHGAGTDIVNPYSPSDDPPPMAALRTNIASPGYDPSTSRRGETAWRRGFSYVVALAPRSGAAREIFCSGALVPPKWIVTAAHCLYDPATDTQRNPQSYSAYIAFESGSDTLISPNGGQSIGMRPLSILNANWIGAPGRQFPTSESAMIQEVQDGNDLAILEIDQPSLTALPLTVRTVSLYGNDQISPPITVAGYGRTNAKAEVNNLALEIAARTGPLGSNDHAFVTLPPSDPTVAHQPRVCPGDSGAPVLAGALNGNLSESHQLIGIVSGAAGEDTGGTAICMKGQQYITRLTRPEVRTWFCKITSTCI